MGAQIWKGWAVGGLLLAGVTLGAFSPASSQNESGPVDLQLAVVSYDQLIQAHPDFTSLSQLDERLKLLSEDRAMIEVRAKRALMAEAGQEMKQAVAEGEQEMMAEKQRIESELAAISAGMANQMQAEMNRLQAGYEKELEEAIKKLGAGASTQEMPVADSVQGQVKEYLENLSLVRERNLASRRLELEKQVQAEILAEQQRLDAEVATYEDQLAGKYQAEKLNLQLKVQNAADDAERSEAEARLGAIADEINAAKTARRGEIGQQMSTFRTEKASWLEAELANYQKTLDTEVQQKLAAKRVELGGAPPKAAGPAPEIAAKIEQIQRSLQGELEVKKANLRARMEAESKAAGETLRKKQQEIEKRLRETEEELTARIEAQAENMDDDLKAEIDAAEKEIEEAESQRDALYKKMVDELNKTVGEIAEKEKTPMVIGSFVVNRDCDDLTDKAMVAVKQMER